MAVERHKRIVLRLRKRQRAVLIAALICFFLGLGNIALGALRIQSYDQSLAEALRELSPEDRERVSGSGPTVNVDYQTQHITRLRARRELYRVVEVGGEILVSVGLVLLLGYLLSRSLEGSASAVEHPGQTKP